MRTPPPQLRAGYTIMELLVVVAVVLLLGAIIVPTISAFWADSRTKVGVDMVQSRLADARGQAVAHNRNYQVLVSPDGTKIQVAADPSEQVEPSEAGTTTNIFSITSDLPKTVILTPISTGVDANSESSGSSGWTKLITYKPDGTCVEEAAEFSISEPGVIPQVIRVRGMTGSVTVNRQNDPNATSVGNRTP